MKNKVFNTTLGVMSALALIQAAPAFADPAAADQAAPANAAKASDVGLSDVIVTARRVEERLQDVPISISVFNQQQLNNLNVVSTQDLAAYTPSVSVNNNFGSLNTAFAIRGFVQDIGTQPAVGVYFADVIAPRGASNNIPIGDGAGPGNFFDLQNVQVLKGPQSTLFGRNTTGGAILMVPQKPTSKQEGYIEYSYGNYAMNRIQAVVNLPLSDIMRFRIGFDRQSRQGYESSDTGVAPVRFGDVNYSAVRASFVVDITPDLENYTIGSYMDSDVNGEFQKLVGCNPALNPSELSGTDGLRSDRSGAGERRWVLYDAEYSPKPLYPPAAVAGHQHDNLARHRYADGQEHRQLCRVAGKAQNAAVRDELPPHLPAFHSAARHSFRFRQ